MTWIKSLLGWTFLARSQYSGKGRRSAMELFGGAFLLFSIKQTTDSGVFAPFWQRVESFTRYGDVLEHELPRRIRSTLHWAGLVQHLLSNRWLKVNKCHIGANYRRVGKEKTDFFFFCQTAFSWGFLPKTFLIKCEENNLKKTQWRSREGPQFRDINCFIQHEVFWRSTEVITMHNKANPNFL